MVISSSSLSWLAWETKTEFERWLDAPKKAKDAALEAIYAKATTQTSGATK